MMIWWCLIFAKDLFFISIPITFWPKTMGNEDQMQCRHINNVTSGRKTLLTFEEKKNAVLYEVKYNSRSTSRVLFVWRTVLNLVTTSRQQLNVNAKCNCLLWNICILYKTTFDRLAYMWGCFFFQIFLFSAIPFDRNWCESIEIVYKFRNCVNQMGDDI